MIKDESCLYVASLAYIIPIETREEDNRLDPLRSSVDEQRRIGFNNISSTRRRLRLSDCTALNIPRECSKYFPEWPKHVHIPHCDQRCKDIQWLSFQEGTFGHWILVVYYYILMIVCLYHREWWPLTNLRYEVHTPLLAFLKQVPSRWASCVDDEPSNLVADVFVCVELWALKWVESRTFLWWLGPTYAPTRKHCTINIDSFQARTWKRKRVRIQIVSHVQSIEFYDPHLHNSLDYPRDDKTNICSLFWTMTGTTSSSRIAPRVW